MSYSIGLFLTYLTYQTVFRILACCQKCQAILLSYCWIIIHWYINHIVFIHSSVDGHLGCFCILNIVNKAAISVGVYIFLKNTVFISFGYVLNSGVTGLCGRPAFNFLRNLHIVFHTMEPIYIPISSVWGFLFFFLMASLPELVLPCLLDDDHFDRCEVIIFHCSFDLHFPADVILCIFSCVRCPFWCPLLHNISLAVLLDFSLPQIVVRE